MGLSWESSDSGKYLGEMVNSQLNMCSQCDAAASRGMSNYSREDILHLDMILVGALLKCYLQVNCSHFKEDATKGSKNR